ncbi:MAG: hypothetical protein QGM49_10335, partial [Actinomycetota bacterium]|nr:hypothetical protein [Actinomycetota bacterium]
MALAESLDELSPSAAAHQDGHAGAKEPGKGRPDVSERSTVLKKGFLLRFEPGGDLVEARMDRIDGVELGTEVV